MFRFKTPPTTRPLSSADVATLAEQVNAARGRRELLGGDAEAVLTEVPSEDELAQARGLAEWKRAAQREAERSEIDSQLAAAAALREADRALREADIRDTIDARKALAAQRRAETPTSTIAELHRYSRWTRYGCGAIIAAGMVWSAINVQHNMAPGGASDPLYWVSFLVEGMISGLLVIIALGTGKNRDAAGVEPAVGIRWAEVGLFLLTLVLNVYPYVAVSHWYDAATHGIAPVLIGATLLVLHSMSGDYAKSRRVVAARIGSLDTVQSPWLPTVHTVHPDRAPRSYSPAEPDTVHRAPQDTEQAASTVHPSDEPEPCTVHPETSPASETVQEPCTVHPETVQHGIADGADPAVGSTVHPTLHTEQHTEHTAEKSVRAPEAAHRHSAGRAESEPLLPAPRTDRPARATAGAVSAPVSEPTVQADPEPTTGGHDTAADTVQGEGVAEAAADRAPSTVHPATVQEPSTVHPTVQPSTVHRAGTGETVHLAARTVHPSADQDTVHRAGESANDEHDPTGAEDDAELWALAAEVHGQLRRTKFGPEDVARVLIAHRRHGLGADRIYRDKIGPHRETTSKWLSLAAQIEQERTANVAPVITLRDRG